MAMQAGDKGWEAFRLYGSQKTSRNLGRAGKVLGAAGAVALLAGAAPLAAVCSSVGLVLFLLASRVTLPELECAFCRKPRASVTLMVAGPSVAICDECTGLSMAVFNEDSQAKKSDAWLRVLLASLPYRCPRAISGPLLRAMPATTVEARARLLHRAFELGNPTAVIELIERVPEAERASSEWINLGVALENDERYLEGIAATQRIAGNPDDEPFLLNNVAAMRLHLDPTPAELQTLLEHNQRARELISTRDPAHMAPVLASMWGTAAELHRRLGQPEAALRALREAEKVGHPAPERLVTEAHLALAAGRSAEARNRLLAVLDLAHPESREAREAARLLEGCPAP